MQQTQMFCTDDDFGQGMCPLKYGRISAGKGATGVVFSATNTEHVTGVQKWMERYQTTQLWQVTVGLEDLNVLQEMVSLCKPEPILFCCDQLLYGQTWREVLAVVLLVSTTVVCKPQDPCCDMHHLIEG